jgi:4a-hydroxytetrahydrobiopterin dehydratase
MNEPNKDTWIERDGALEKAYQFAGFADAMAFMGRVAFECERLDHHPEWRNIYNRVEVRLTTHSAQNTITEKDHELSRIMDHIFKTFASS